MANKPSYSAARKARGTASMTIEPMPEKKSFTDSNLDTKYLPQDIPAKGGSITAEPNAKSEPAKNTLIKL